MRKLFGLIVLSGFVLAGIATASAFAPPAGSVPTQPSLSGVERVQYDGNLCRNWHEQCARLYGYQTQRWHACMHQPDALYDCGRGGRRHRGGGYGGYDREYGGYGGSYSRPSGSLCSNWHQQCARLYGPNTPRWNQCMQQPAAIWDCQRGL